MFSTECIIYCYMIHQYYGGKITIDQIVYIIQSNSIFIEYFMLLFENHTNLSVNTIYFQSLQNIKKNNKEVNKHVQQCKDDNNCIEMEEISYSYKKTLGYAINNINVEIKKGEKIALLGENGCGKSTFIKIITSLIEPDTGSIRASQKQSVVFQDFAKFKLKLSENIFIGELKKKDDTEAIIDALEKSGGTGMLARLPYGIESELNKEFNTYGVDLSGGEWQKIGIGRGLFRLANVIVLDEPTASLDPLAEVKEFEKLLTGSLKNQTVIIVSHRASVAKKVDRILFMKDGEIVEDGSFKQLINLKGKFYDFYKIQAKWYK